MRIKAFTLIELLIVVVIVGALATTITVSVMSTRVKARDARRQADFGTMERTLAKYYTDHFKYPDEFKFCDSSVGSDPNSNPCPPQGVNLTYSWDHSAPFYTQLVNAYLPNLPSDPLNSATYYYQYEPSNNPITQCYFWIYYTEAGAAQQVRHDVGDLRDSSGTMQSTCNF